MEKGTSIPMRPGAELGEQEYDGYDEMIHDHARIRFGVEEDQSGLVHRGGCDDGGNEAAPSRSDGEGSVFEILRWIELQVRAYFLNLDPLIEKVLRLETFSRPPICQLHADVVCRR